MSYELSKCIYVVVWDSTRGSQLGWIHHIATTLYYNLCFNTALQMPFLPLVWSVILIVTQWSKAPNWFLRVYKLISEGVQLWALLAPLCDLIICENKMHHTCYWITYLFLSIISRWIAYICEWHPTIISLKFYESVCKDAYPGLAKTTRI